jgi:hypothetical protein
MPSSTVPLRPVSSSSSYSLEINNSSRNSRLAIPSTGSSSNNNSSSNLDCQQQDSNRLSSDYHHHSSSHCSHTSNMEDSSNSSHFSSWRQVSLERRFISIF